MLHCSKAATRGKSLSRGSRNPQIESVKKNLVIESCESIFESFALGAAILLRRRRRVVPALGQAEGARPEARALRRQSFLIE
jgi:hypothetical protein